MGTRAKRSPANMPRIDLFRKYGLTKGSVLNIRNRKTFAHVEAA